MDDPLSFLGTYTGRPDRELPPSLQNVVIEYLLTEKWYSQIKGIKDLRITPWVKLLFHLNNLVASGYPNQVDSLLDLLYWSKPGAHPKVSSPKVMFTRASEKGYLPLVGYLSFAVGDYPPARAAFWAAAGGHREVVNYILFLGGNRKYVLQGGARGNQKEIVDYALSLGAEISQIVLNCAVRGNYPEMVSYLLTLAPVERDIRNALGMARNLSVAGDRSEIIRRLERALEERNPPRIPPEIPVNAYLVPIPTSTLTSAIREADIHKQR